MAIDERAPSALEKRLRAPKHDRRGEQKLDPQEWRVAHRPHQRLARQHVGHRDQQQRNRQCRAHPEAPRHVGEFGIGRLLGRDRARLERHPALRAIPRMVLHDLGMHRADVFDLSGRRRRERGFERHPALRTRAGSVGVHLGIHRAGVFGGGRRGRAMRRGIRRVHRVTAVPRVPMMGRRCGLLRRPHRRPIGARVVVMAGGVRPACGRTDPARRRRDGRLRRRAGEIFRRLGGEFRAAAVATEIVGDAVVDVRVPGGRGIDLHPAYRIGRLQSRLRLRRRRTLCSGRAHNRIKCRAAPLPRLSLP